MASGGFGVVFAWFWGGFGLGLGASNRLDFVAQTLVFIVCSRTVNVTYTITKNNINIAFYCLFLHIFCFLLILNHLILLFLAFSMLFIDILPISACYCGQKSNAYKCGENAAKTSLYDS